MICSVFFVLKAGMHQPLNQTEAHHDTSGGTNTVPPKNREFGD